MHTSTHTALYDPGGLIEAELPLDREPYECLVKAVHQHAAGARKRGTCKRNRRAASPPSRTTTASDARAAA